MKFSGIKNYVILFLTLFGLSLLLLSGCKKDKDELSLSILLPEAEYSAGSQFFNYKGFR